VIATATEVALVERVETLERQSNSSWTSWRTRTCSPRSRARRSAGDRIERVSSQLSPGPRRRCSALAYGSRSTAAAGMNPTRSYITSRDATERQAARPRRGFPCCKVGIILCVGLGKLMRRARQRASIEVEAAHAAALLASDLTSGLRLRRLLLARLGHVRASGPPTETVRLRPLHGHSVELRVLAADVRTVLDVFLDREHLPPRLPRPPRLILDLGANIGLTIAHFATLYPDARIIGAELDPANAELAQANTRPWADRCHVVAAAVWIEDGAVRYIEKHGREVSHAIASGPEATATAAAISIDSLINQAVGESGGVDYVKMDIEGAEVEVLRNGASWANRVRAIKVEIHPPYTLDDCLTDLERLGFVVHTERGRCDYVSGQRAYS
jgi:FkbM family methyltransferase